MTPPTGVRARVYEREREREERERERERKRGREREYMCLCSCVVLTTTRPGQYEVIDGNVTTTANNHLPLDLQNQQWETWKIDATIHTDQED